jgi:acyl-CoA thioesterase-2
MSHTTWDELDIAALLTLDPAGPGRWRSRHGDGNHNGRSFGGQLLGQAMAAALMDVPDRRAPTMMQFLFLQGAVPEESVELQVATLQEGKRFSSRHVRAEQGNGRTVLDAHVTCALPLEAPEHCSPSMVPHGERPEVLPGLDDLSLDLRRAIHRPDGKPSIEFRIPNAKQQLSVQFSGRSFRFWMRAAHALPDDPRIHAAAFAYLSDWWLNFSSLGLHLPELRSRSLYITSLNHAMWLHRPPRVDQWLHVRTVSPASAAGRGLSIGEVHNIEGCHLATLAQQCLMTYAG